MAKPAKVTRFLHSQDLNRAMYETGGDGRVGGTRPHRCLATLQRKDDSPAVRVRDPQCLYGRGLRLARLPERLGKATLTDALGDIQAGREAAKV